MRTAVGAPIRLSALADPAPALAALERIFFESASRTEFASADERSAFFARWTSFYLERCRDDVWFWREPDGILSAYLTGCRDSAGAAPLYQSLPAYALFESSFVAFPAHLHVNCRGDRRNLGIGGRLIDVFAEECRRAGLTGVHVVTAPEARNVRFYQRAGFTERVLRAFSGRPLLLLGRRLMAESSV